MTVLIDRRSPDAPTALTTFAEQEFEQLLVSRDPAGGPRGFIAVHDTSLGPALGGVRVRRYPDDETAAADALRLARAMTYKAALAGLPLGGGKSVINADPRTEKTAAVLAAHGRAIGLLGGHYIPAADMGTGPEDLRVIAEYTPVVASAERDPSPSTARGVVAAMRAVARRRGHDSLAGLSVAVQGVGNVGQHIVELLHAERARTVVDDLDRGRVRDVVGRFGATPADGSDVLLADVDLVCPAGAGLVLDAERVDQLRAWAVVPAANNPLAGDEQAQRLRGRGIDYVPDFVANAGGLISCEAEIRGVSEFGDQLESIGGTTAEILAAADADGVDSLTAATALADRRIAAARRRTAGA